MRSLITFRLQALLACAFGWAAAITPSFAQTYPPYPPSDIDIYGQSPSGANAVPNVLFVLDDSANWNANNGQAQCYYNENKVPTTTGPTTNGKKFSIEQCALYNVIDALDIGPNDTALYNIGIMVFNNTNVSTGARVIKALTPLTAAGKSDLKAMIKNLTNNQSPAPTSYGLSMHEAYLYYTQGTPYSGQRAGVLPYDPAAFSGGKYTLPTNSGCGGNNVIIIANGPPQGDWIANATVQNLLQAAGGDTTQITYPGSIVDPKDVANWTDEYARFMNNNLGITTYAVAVTGANSDKATYPAIFDGIAHYGGGKFYEAKDVNTLTLNLQDIFNRLAAVNSVFASASLPVSVNARGTYLNQVFMGMFRPDDKSGPRWRGNLKQYKFNYDQTTDTLYLAGADGQPAINSTTGFITPSAISYWTAQDATGSTGFWVNQPMGTPKSAFDYPDGEVVEKGGAAQQIRITYATSQTSRNVYTCIACLSAPNTLQTPTTPTAFNKTLITPSQLGLASTDTTQRDLLVDWVRGTDNQVDAQGLNVEKGPGSPTTIRPSVHGDVLHSRPAVVNFGGLNGAQNVVVFYGANDGMLHAVNGNQTGTGAGQELWAFVPEEHFTKLKRLRDNTPEVGVSTSTTTSALPRDYFVDGSISVYQRMASDGTTSKAILYVTMRRGGRVMYALDVTNPSAPKHLWKINGATNTTFKQLGQTWSEPRLARVKGRTNPILVMGGGYDATAEDATPAGSTTMGNAIYVLDAFTGELIKQFNTDRAVPADVALVDIDKDNYTDRAYAVDLGGNVYRVDFETPSSTAVADWGIYKFAALQGSTATNKFFFAPDVVVTPTFTAVQVGSGDREKPRLGTNQDYFFTVFDNRMDKGTTANFTPIQKSNLGQTGSASANMDAGCYISLDTGEKVVNAATTFRGVTYFGTNNPNKTSNTSGQMCVNLGQAKTYAAPLFCSAPTSQILNGGGLPPSPVAGFVTITYTQQNADGTTTTVTKDKEFVIGAPNTKKSGIENGPVKTTLSLPRKRRYWFQENTR